MMILSTLALIYANTASTSTMLQAQEFEYLIGKEALQHELYNDFPDMIVFSPRLIAPVMRRPSLQTPGFIEWRSQSQNYGTVQLRKYLCKLRASASKTSGSLPLIKLHQGHKKVRTFIVDWKGEMKRR